jgi:hypothetical protein
MSKEKNDITKMEFLLTLNDNIIVQRYFNVKGYNENTKNSIDLHETVNDIKNAIHNDLKIKTVTYMLENEFQILSDPMILETSMTDDEENFNIFIKLGEDTIYHRAWDGKIYPPKVRYTVDVRPHLKGILKSLTDIFSADKLSCEFMEYKLG